MELSGSGGAVERKKFFDVGNLGIMGRLVGIEAEPHVDAS
jgi:hypothetical protein